MRVMNKVAIASLLLVQTAGAFAQTAPAAGTAAGPDAAVSHSRGNIAGGVIVGGILIAVAAVAATGGNDGLADTSKPVVPVIVPPVTTPPSTSTSTSTRTR